MFIEDNGESVEVRDPILQEKVRFLVSRGDDHRYHPDPGVNLDEIRRLYETNPNQ